MFRPLLPILLVFAMLLGSFAVPAIADAGQVDHVIEIADSNCEQTTQPEQGHDDSSPDHNGQNTHHHCASGLVLTNEARLPLHLAQRILDALPLSSALASHPTAPLTEPPAA